MLSSTSFQTGRKTQTQSSVKTTQGAEKANGSLVLSRIENPAEGPTQPPKFRKKLHPRSSAARWESSCPLDKDLSRKSLLERVVFVRIPLDRYRRLSGAGIAPSCFIERSNWLLILSPLKRVRNGTDLVLETGEN